MPLLDPYFATRRRLNAGLVIAGFLGGATFGLAMTRIGKIVAEAPPAGAAILFGVSVLILVLPPLGLAFGFKRLEQRYRAPQALPEESSAS